MNVPLVSRKKLDSKIMRGHFQTTNTLKISDQNLLLYAVVVRLFDGNPRYHQHTSDFQSIFARLIKYFIYIYIIFE